MNLHQALSDQFYAWEVRGRGWKVWPEPVSPEPPYSPFIYTLPKAADDGRRPSFLGAIARQLGWLSDPHNIPPVIPAASEEEPVPLVREDLVEVETSLPAKLDLAKEAFEPFLANLSLSREPIAFELLGTPGRIAVQFAASSTDAPQLRRQLAAYFAEAVFQPRPSKLPEMWWDSTGDEAVVVEFGLAKEFVLPLSSGKLDPFVGLIGALSSLEAGELALFQVIFQAVENPWSQGITYALTYPDGGPFFVNAPELTQAAEKKACRPLFAAVVRLGVKTERYERTIGVAREMAASLRVFADPAGNELIPLSNDEYPFDEHVSDLLCRQSRRSGMILNCDELIGFVHLPSSAVRSTILARQTTKTKAVPKHLTEDRGVCLGENSHLGETHPVFLSREDRVRHTHILGASGTGKSTLLFNMIRQDIEKGEGLAVLDPHGDLIDRILGVIPPSRIDDVILLDPADEDYSIGFNILSAHSELEKNLLASDLVSVFERLSTSWGDQMASVLNNGIRAFLESSQGGTLAELRRFLLEPSFRERFLTTVHDPEIVYYWRKGFTQLSGNKSIGPILTRLETFLSPKPIRYMVSQKENRLDFGNILDTGKIFLARLSQGAIGRENSFLLGSLLVAKFQETAMSRQQTATGLRRDFWLYLDEFHNFITPSMAEILTGARKYRIGLILAHQELRQLQRNSEVASAVLSNPYTRICFRVGDDDARKLAEGFAFFEARDLQNLTTGQAICRVEKSDYDFNLAVAPPGVPDPIETGSRRNQVIQSSRGKFGTPRAVVESFLTIQSPNPSPPAQGLDTKSEAALPPPILENSQALEDYVESVFETTETAVTAPVRSQPDRKPTEIHQSVETERAIPGKASEALDGLTNKEEQPTTSPKERARKPLTPDLGRGGAQHQAIQKRLKSETEALGFRATIEKQILDGRGSVDLFLERDQMSIACEISVTTTIDHEVRNVLKCLEAELDQIAVISVGQERLKKLQSAIEACTPRKRNSIRYFTPDSFVEYISRLGAAAAPTQTEQTVKRRGYRVTRKLASVTPEEAKLREQAAIKAMAEVMREKRKRRPSA